MPEVAPVRIGERRVGAGEPAYVIAELSCNHHQRLAEAIELVRAAKTAGADAVKLQTYTPDTMTLDLDEPLFRIGDHPLWGGRTLYDLYGEAFTPWEWHPTLIEEANRLGLHAFSSPFDATAVDFLDNLGVPVFKIASFECVDIPLIQRVARTGKPAIISTGMASLGEIEDAVRAFREAGGRDLILLKCTSAYPAPPEEMNLASISALGAAFGVPVGLSDHTLTTGIPVAGVALGACVIEKHFILSRAQGGPDSAFSLEPHEFARMVEDVRLVERAMGKVSFGPTPHEEGSRIFRRSLFVVADVAQGEELTAENLRAIRPGYGLPPKHLSQVLGMKAARGIARGTPLTWDLVTR